VIPEQLPRKFLDRVLGSHDPDFRAAYTLWLVKRSSSATSANHHVAELEDVGSREIIMLSLLAAACCC